VHRRGRGRLDVAAVRAQRALEGLDRGSGQFDVDARRCQLAAQAILGSPQRAAGVSAGERAAHAQRLCRARLVQKAQECLRKRVRRAARPAHRAAGRHAGFEARPHRAASAVATRAESVPRSLAPNSVAVTDERVIQV
jgi:hypothetical protein